MNTLTSREQRSLFPRLGDARLQVVAPGAPACLPRTFSCVVSNVRRHAETIDRIQRFRHRVYRDDGAIPPGDPAEAACHRSDSDPRSWHLLVTGVDEEILACVRYTHFVDRPIRLDSLHLMRMVARAEPATARNLRAAVQAFLDQANRRAVGLSEFGGWATCPEARNSVKGLVLACACCSLGELLADGFAVATATTRHHSAHILRRLGGFRLDSGGSELPAFFDPYHGCEIQLMGFTMPRLAPSYRPTVDDITRYLRNAPVLVH